MLFCRRRRHRVVTAAFRKAHWAAFHSRLGCYFFSATASPGVLDAVTNGGLGLAFFTSFDNRRYFSPFHPVAVSSSSVEAIL